MPTIFSADSSTAGNSRFADEGNARFTASRIVDEFEVVVGGVEAVVDGVDDVGVGEHGNMTILQANNRSLARQ